MLSVRGGGHRRAAHQTLAFSIGERRLDVARRQPTCEQERELLKNSSMLIAAGVDAGYATTVAASGFGQ
jgi:hypothetical protein